MSADREVINLYLSKHCFLRASVVRFGADSFLDLG
jgi:hypothetical protein